MYDVEMQKLCFYKLEKEFSGVFCSFGWWFCVLGVVFCFFFFIFSGKILSGSTDFMCASHTCGACGQGTTFYHTSATLHAADNFSRL